MKKILGLAMILAQATLAQAASERGFSSGYCQQNPDFSPIVDGKKVHVKFERIGSSLYNVDVTVFKSDGGIHLDLVQVPDHSFEAQLSGDEDLYFFQSTTDGAYFQMYGEDMDQCFIRVPGLIDESIYVACEAEGI